MQKITPFLWFDNNAEEAVNYYLSVFKDAKIKSTTRYEEEAAKATGMQPGTAMTVSFELFGLEFVALNAGPHFKFNEAVSFVVNCKDQEEIDYYWEKLGEGGDPKAQQCGWLKDKFGLSWQVTPINISELISDPDPVKAQKAMGAMMQMKKLDIAKLKEAKNS